MDNLERANNEYDQHLSVLLKNARSSNKNSAYTGHCKYCNDTIKNGAFCNDWCRSDYENEHIAKKRQGRI